MNQASTIESASLYKLDVKKPSLFALVFLISFGTIGAVLFTPALPQISQFFHVSANAAQLSVSAYLLGYAFGQLPYGPIANRFGRKKAILIGIILEITGASLCLLAAPLHTFYLLVAARFVTALGACVGLTMSFTIIHDYFHEQQARKAITCVVTTFSVIPGISIMIGGFITHYFGWIACFYFLVFYGFLMLFLMRALPETATHLDRTALNLSNMAQRFGVCLKNKRLLMYAIMAGSCSSCVYLFNTLGPFLGIHLIGITAQQYGLMSLIPSVGFLSGGLLANRLTAILQARQIMQIGILIAATGVLAFLALMLQTSVSAWDLFLPIAILQFALAMIFPNCSALATRDILDKSTASSILMFLNMGIAVLSVFAGGFLPISHATVLPILLTIALSVLSFIFWLARE